MTNIFAILEISICLSMFFLKRNHKLYLLLLSYMLLTLAYIPKVPYATANNFVSLFFIISEFKRIPSCIRVVNKTKLNRILSVLIISFLTTLLTSPHLWNFKGFANYFFAEFIFKNLALFYGFFSIRNTLDIKSLLKVIALGIIIITIAGIHNYITQRAFFVAELTQGAVGASAMSESSTGEFYAESDRFRVQSLFVNAFNYGYVYIPCLLLYIYGFQKGLCSIKILSLIVLCSIFGVVSCGCRTVLLCFAMSIFIYLFLAYDIKERAKILLILPVLIILSYEFVPIVQDKINDILTMFDTNSDYHGSTWQMRSIQFLTVISYIQDHWLFGNGYFYFFEDLGWAKGRMNALNSDLQGLEGAYLNRLLERGIIWLLLYIVLFINIIHLFLKKATTHRKEVALGISITSALLAFSTMTGELYAPFISFLLIGIVYKVILINKYNNQ